LNSEDNLCQNALEKLYSYETLGISDDEDDQCENKMIQRFRDSIQYTNDRYSVKLPWKSDTLSQVKSHPEIVYSVMMSVHKRLHEENLVDQYEELFNEYERLGYIEQFECTPTEARNFIWLPHHCVKKFNSQNELVKIRPVFNASFKVANEASLNTASYVGLNLLNNIVELIIKFRLHRYTLIADIKNAFLNIELSEVDDRNRLCFMWKQGNKTVYYKFCVLPWGLASAPFVLNYVLKYHFEKHIDNPLTASIKDSFYVDNLITSVPDAEKAINLFHHSRELLKKGGFFIRDFNSNLEKVREEAKALDIASSKGQKEMTLGYEYDTKLDTLSLADFKLEAKRYTKRTVLSMFASIFDPMGYYAPVLIKGKLFIRKLWTLELSWDQPLKPELVHEWTLLKNSFQTLKPISIPRFYLDHAYDSPCKLIFFCDANLTSYGFCVYLVCNARSLLLFSKNHQAPKNKNTVPRLELMAIVLAVKCIKTLLNALHLCNISDIYIFSDSQVSLNRILNTNASVDSIFVRNRLKQIHEVVASVNTEYLFTVHWKYVTSEDNPADMITKGITPELFARRLNFWIHGPQFITLDSDAWPVNRLPCIKTELCKQLNTLRTTSENTTIIDITRYSSFNKLLRITAKLFEFSNKTRKRHDDVRIRAYEFLIKLTQSNSLTDELRYLRNPTRDKIPNLVNQLNLYLDENDVIRCKGRLDKCSLLANKLKNPILIPRNTHLTNLLIMHYHEKLFHLGLSSTVNEIRKNGIWIPSIRTAVKTVIKNCILCRKINAYAFRYPKMTHLTKSQTQFIKPFHFIGFDFTSHVYVKNTHINNTQKMYIFIITCLNTRAIHLDLLPDMTTNSILMSLRRHFCKYGIPQIIFSDNQTSFISAGKELEKAISSSDYNEFLNHHAIKHIRIPVYSSWIGSAWERMLRIVKQCLYKTIKRNTLTYFEFYTLLQEIADAINNRPLTYHADDLNLFPLTPNNFIKPATGNAKLDMEETQPYFSTDESEYRNSIAKIQDLYRQFKQRWYDEYLISLREQSTKLYQSDWTNRIKIGDLVIIKDSMRPRVFWQMGRVVDTIAGSDTNIRSVQLQKSDGTVVHHSINNLYPLELSITHPDRDNYESSPLGENSTHSESVPSTSKNTQFSHPKRKAAMISQQNWREKLSDLSDP